MLTEFHSYKIVRHFDKLNCNMLTPINDGKIAFKLSEDLIKFLNYHINDIITDNNNLDFNRTINLIIK